MCNCSDCMLLNCPSKIMGYSEVMCWTLRGNVKIEEMVIKWPCVLLVMEWAVDSVVTIFGELCMLTLTSLEPFVEVMLTVISGAESEDAMCWMLNSFWLGCGACDLQGPRCLGDGRLLWSYQFFGSWNRFGYKLGIVFGQLGGLGHSTLDICMDIGEWFFLSCISWSADIDSVLWSWRQAHCIFAAFCAWHLVISLSNVRSVSCRASSFVPASSRPSISMLQILLMV